MSIEKDSTGLPEVDLTRRTTKVNLGMVVGAAVFLAVMFTILFLLAQRSDREANQPSPPLEQGSASGSAAGPAPKGSNR
jgi:hypothetical protein